ncbi:hypothetical protein D3C86_1878160 [compost metagenome]
MRFRAEYATWDDVLKLRGEHVTAGPTFKIACNTSLAGLRNFERRGAEANAQHLILQGIRDQVMAHNAVVRPIDNGPEPLVYLVETCTRLADAVAAARDGKPDHEELIAACRANTYAGHEAVAFFNQSTTP